MCKKVLPEPVARCPRCSTDLSLLNDYVSHLHDGLARAETLTRQGELGEAVWAYLEVLEVDPENAVARRQVGKVATAVRQFDQAAPGPRWLQRLSRQARLRSWLPRSLAEKPHNILLISAALLACLIVVFFLGFYFGQHAAQPADGEEKEAETVGIAR
jgi:hypothetical protein